MYITEEHKEKIGEYIKFIREEMDLTQGELSGEDKAVEFYICSKKQLSNIEQGKNIPSLPVLTRLLGRLGKSIEDLATYINDGEKIKFNNEYEIIGELIHKGNYEEAKIKYDKLKEL
ncbi:MAG: helix-turn-helix domain-containing protein, partial [Defluviitaleaceae bacterium]|nr:helix-turn-helix domain-containing protein [Defluviitaleaceae bacterium]